MQNSKSPVGTTDDKSINVDVNPSSQTCTKPMLADVLTQIVRERLDELIIENWWDFWDFVEIRDKDYVASQIVNDVLKHIG
jgi:hypothetical protein